MTKYYAIYQIEVNIAQEHEGAETQYVLESPPFDWQHATLEAAERELEQSADNRHAYTILPLYVT